MKRNKFKCTNSYGVYDAYKYIRKNKWFNIGRPLTEKEFYSIIRTINNLLLDSYLNGEDIVFPLKMGKLELRKYSTYVKFKGNKLVTNRAINWKETNKLWLEDKEAFNNKTLIRYDSKIIFNCKYNKRNAIFKNKNIYMFTFNNILKDKLKNKIINNEIDAFTYGLG